ncbi:MAG: endonuclease/exonuclease/phosphatase family protein [Bdellovibrionia bacterium]
MIRVLTLNVWGLPGIFFWDLAPFREKRIRSVCSELTSQAWDFVLIQEAWRTEDRERFKKCGYPYILDLDSKQNRVDSGLLILSRHPIHADSAQRLRYRFNGDFLTCLTDGEFFANKSLVLADFEHPTEGRICVANTHLVAAGGMRDRYKPQRKLQIEQLSSAIQIKSKLGPVILGGDFNCGPSSEEWTELTQGLDGFTVQDCCPGAHPTYVKKDRREKLDHIFTSSHFRRIGSKIKFDHLVNHRGKSFTPSDHFGWESTFQPTKEIPLA